MFKDGILIYSRSHDERREHLWQILEMLHKENVFTKFFKCEFWLQEVQFLGHVICEYGVQVDPTKIEAVIKCDLPKTPLEIHSNLGLAGYYGQFVENFSSIEALLTKLIRKYVKFNWTGFQEQEFQ